MQLPGVFAVVGALALIIALLLGLRPSARQRWSARWIRDQEAVITPNLRREVEDVRCANALVAWWVPWSV